MKLDSTELNLIYASLVTYDDSLDEVKHETGVNQETWEKCSRLNKALRKKIHHYLKKENAFHQETFWFYDGLLEEKNQNG
jgi:hypothetical protein